MNLFRRGNILPLFLAIGATSILLFPKLVSFPHGWSDLDQSWRWSLPYATSQRLQWGIDYIFTYGPLGYLNVPCYYGSYNLWVISALFVLFSIAVTLQVLVQACLKSGPRAWSATLICELIFCVLLIKAGGYTPQTAIFLTAYGLLCLSLVRESSLAMSLFIAFLLALSSLIKTTAFMGASALVVTNLVAGFVLRDRQKIAHGSVLAAAYPLLLLLLWMASGQALIHFPAYIRGTYEIAAGFDTSMERDGFSYQVILAWLFMGLYLIATGLGWKRNRAQLALFLVTGPVLFLYWKQGFVRQDLSVSVTHALDFFGAILYIFWIHYLTAKAYAPSARDLFLGGAIACLSILYTSVSIYIPAWSPSAAGSNAQNALEATFLFDHEATQERINIDLRKGYNLPPILTSSLQPVPTLVLPWDLILAPAYHLPLAMPPVPQIYSVYTSYLDHVETAWLNKSRPQQVLYSFKSIDERYPLFEGPEFSYHVLRQYTVVANTDTYAVMRRNQSVDPQITWEENQRPGGFDQEIVLPPIESNVHLLMKVGLKRSFLGEIYGFFYKTTSPTIVFHLKDGSTRSGPFIYATGEDGLLVSHFVDNLDQYVRLNKMTWPPNVYSLTFTIDKNLSWQFSDSFPVQFGTSIVTESVGQPTSARVPAF